MTDTALKLSTLLFEETDRKSQEAFMAQFYDLMTETGDWHVFRINNVIRFENQLI